MSGIAVVCDNKNPAPSNENGQLLTDDDEPALFDVSGPALIKSVLQRMEHRGTRTQKIIKTPAAVLGYTAFKLTKRNGSSDKMAIADGRVLYISAAEDGLKEGINRDENLLTLYNRYGRDCVHYMNGPFALVIADGEDIFVARDPLGLKPLYYGKVKNKLIFASEIKGLVPFTEEIKPFPPGYYYHSREGFTEYFSGLEQQEQISSKKKAAETIHRLLLKAVKKRIADVKNLGIYLSGGIDSSILVATAAEVSDNIKTFAVGTEGSRDLQKAKIVADYLGTDHYQYLYNIDDIIANLPEVIFQLESFDQYLVRSSIANYIVGGLAKEHGVELVLCGEGGDELFGGYHYLKKIKDTQGVKKELETLTLSGYANGFQRVDRMNMAHSLLYDMPFMDREVWEYAFKIPVEWKLYGDNEPIEKWILRKAFADDLPEEIIWREKEKFYKGSNTTTAIKNHVEQEITDEEYRKERKIGDKFVLRSKEELYYYRIFRRFYPHRSILDTIGRTRTIE